MKTLLIFILSLVFTTLSSCQEQRRVKCTVLNEDGSPVVGAEVHIAYIGQTPESGASIKGLSNPLGVVVANGSAPLRIKIMVAKKGYYASVVNGLSKLKDHDLKIILRKKKNPIAMYVKHLNGASPVLEKEYGYDFAQGDWVKPFGKGEVSDLLITANVLRKQDKYNDYHIKKTIRFSNENDGFIKFKQSDFSDFKSVYEAPLVADYKKIWVYSREKKPNEAVITNSDRLACYIFRVRTTVDEVGNIVSCHYAKAYGDFPDLKIYFNPNPNDRNLEFDPTKNLFNDLKSYEKVRQP